MAQGASVSTLPSGFLLVTLKAQPQWCTFESPAFAYAILEKPLVGEMDEPFVIHEKDQSGRIDCWLCGVVELEAFACLGWRAVTSNGLLHYVIELGGGVNKELNLTIEALTPSGFKRTIYIPRAVATGAVGMPYRKSEKTVVPVTFQALKSQTEPAVTIVDCAA